MLFIIHMYMYSSLSESFKIQTFVKLLNFTFSKVFHCYIQTINCVWFFSMITDLYLSSKFCVQQFRILCLHYQNMVAQGIRMSVMLLIIHNYKISAIEFNQNTTAGRLKSKYNLLMSATNTTHCTYTYCWKT